MPIKLCECGCDQQINCFDRQKRPRRFVLGHYNKMEENRKRLSKINSGAGNPFYKHHHTEEAKEKNRLAHKKTYEERFGNKEAEKIRKKQSITLKCLYGEGKIKVWSIGLTKETDKRVRKMSESLKGKFAGKKNPMYGKSPTKEQREHHSKILKEKYKKGELIPYWLGKKRLDMYGENNLMKRPNIASKVLESLCKRPTKLEQQLIILIKQNNLPFKYVGNGEFIVGGRCPDFLNINGKKQIIEIFGRYWHSPIYRPTMSYKQTYRATIEHYKKYGFGCLIIWDYELKDSNMIIKKINNFIGDANGK